MAVEPEDGIAEAGEVLAEGGVAPELGHCGEGRQEAVREDLARELDDHAEIADAARGIEGRAELVLDETEAGVAEEAEGGADLAPHRLRPERSGDARDADDVVLPRLGGELVRLRMVEEHEGLEPMAVELRHVLGCAGEVVAVKGEQRARSRFPAGRHRIIPSRRPGTMSDRFSATYLIETDVELAEAAAVIAGEASTATFVKLTGAGGRARRAPARGAGRAHRRARREREAEPAGARVQPRAASAAPR